MRRIAFTNAGGQVLGKSSSRSIGRKVGDGAADDQAP
jgi:hypothetical protein